MASDPASSKEPGAQTEKNSHADNKKSTTSIWAAGLLLFPTATPLVLAGVYAVEKRRVRTFWWVTWAAAAALGGVFVAGGPLLWIKQATGLWGAVVNTAITQVGARDKADEKLAGHPGISDWLHTGFGSAILWQALFSLALVSAGTAIYSHRRSRDRELLGGIEGSEYSNLRPVGILDRLIGRWYRQQIRRGVYTVAPTNRNDGQVALGVGRYLRPVVTPFSTFKMPSLFLGMIRSGKSRLANSVGRQHVMSFGGGHIVICFKGGNDIPAYWAEVAQQAGRSFYHFVFNDKSGGGYTQPHPYAPDAPARYDPLIRGNGDSKTDMLLDSVDRDGDAAAYLRTAQDAVRLAFDLADYTGFSWNKGGLETLAGMLDLETLERTSHTLKPEHLVRGGFAASDDDAWQKIRAMQDRIGALQKTGNSALMRGAISDSQTTISKYANSSAIGGRLRPGDSPANTIDLVRAVLRGEIVVFSLSANDYPSMSALVATMVLLDLQNVLATLRKNIKSVAAITNTSIAKADSTAWKPYGIQLEELGAVRSPAAATAILGLLNKSSNEGFRLFLSSQGWADFIAMDGSGGWSEQVLPSVQNIFGFTLGSDSDDEKIAAQSGAVSKKYAQESLTQRKHRWRRTHLKIDDVGAVVPRTEPRIPQGALQSLPNSDHNDDRQFAWIMAKPTRKATHSSDEGPNNWFEPIHMVTVGEPDYQKDFFADPQAVTDAAQQRDRERQSLLHDLTHSRMLNHVLQPHASATYSPKSDEQSGPNDFEDGSVAAKPAPRRLLASTRPTSPAAIGPSTPQHADPNQQDRDWESFFDVAETSASTESTTGRPSHHARKNNEVDGLLLEKTAAEAHSVEKQNDVIAQDPTTPSHKDDTGDYPSFDASDL